MSQRVVTLPSGKRVTLGSYVRGWKRLKTMPWDTHIPDWDWHYTTAREVLGALRESIDERINRHIPNYGVGRKWDPNWYSYVWRTARLVNQRCIIDCAPPEILPRIQHRLRKNLI